MSGKIIRIIFEIGDVRLLAKILKDRIKSQKTPVQRRLRENDLERGQEVLALLNAHIEAEE